MSQLPGGEKKDFLDGILEHKGSFLSMFLLIFAVTYGVFFAVNFIPEAPEGTKTDAVTVTQNPDPTPKRMVVADPYPQRLLIDALGTDIGIENPTSRTVADLDAALLHGSVRHPDSADFAREGTIVLFGHSSYLPQVLNKNFQAFNEIQTLAWGDTIRLQSSDTEYRYRVTKVYKVKASDATVALSNESARLTLVTCNSFGTKDDRFIVEAELTDSYPIGTSHS